MDKTESRETAGIEGWSTKKRLWRGGTLSKASSHIHTGRGVRPGSCCRTPQLCCYLLHFRQSPRRGAPNPCALPIESASGPFGGLGEGQENLGGNRADGLPAWFRLPSASPGGGFGSCSHRDVACEPRRTADWVTVPLLLLRVRLPLSGLLWRWTMPGPDRSSWVWHRPCQSAMRRSPCPSGPKGPTVSDFG